MQQKMHQEIDGQRMMMLQIYSNEMLDVKKDRPNDETPFAKHRGGDHWVCPLPIITLKAVFGSVLSSSNYLAAPPASTALYW